MTLTRGTAQLELCREAMLVTDGRGRASDELAIELAMAGGREVLAMPAVELLDSYVGCRLETLEAAVLSVQNRYIEAESHALVMIGHSLLEVQHWIVAARRYVRSDLRRRPPPPLIMAA